MLCLFYFHHCGFTKPAHLKKKEENRYRQLSGLVLSCDAFFTPLGVLLATKTLTDEWYIIIKAYKFEILRILLYTY